jgi:PAS domain S-box-containing protein
MAGITFDITAETEAAERLRESENRLATLAANVEGAIFRYHMHADGTDSISYMSDGAEQVWGMKVEEMVGDPSRVWETVHPDDLAGVRQMFEQGARTLGRLSHRWRIHLPDGDVRWIECRASPKLTPEGEFVWDGFVIDISEMMAARDELRRATEMLGQAQKLEAIGRISGGIAHDFNNLLAVVMGNAELIDPAELVDEDRASLDAIVAACRKGADLTRRLLSFARKSQLNPSRVSLRKVVGDMVPLIRRTLPENIEIVWDSDKAADLDVAVDLALLKASILNILVNARDAMPAGGRVVIGVTEHRIDTPGGLLAPGLGKGVAVPGIYAALSIADTGHGIPTHLIDRIAEPFVTTKGPEMGSGLGLAMVDGFVAQSGGFLEIRSEQGKGAEITINIPRVVTGPDNARPADAGVPRMPMSRAQPGFGRALLVEDEEQVRLVTARLLGRMGIEVDAVPTADEALVRLQAEAGAYDLLISDLVMPGSLNGADLALVAQTLRPDLPIVLMTGYGPEQIAPEVDLDRLGIVLRKPIERGAFEAAVVNALALRLKG